MSAAAQAFDAAVMMMRAGKIEEAGNLCWEIVRKDRTVTDAWKMLAYVEASAQRYRNATMYYGIALQTDAQRWDIWHDSAINAMSARMYEESERAFKKALALHDNGQTRYNYGNLLSALMRVDEAVDQFKAAMQMGFDDPQIHPNLGVAMIAQGKWHEGFNAYRHRFNAPGFPPRPRFDYPLWRGEPIDGKTVMLYVEQGFGDEIMSLRFASTLKAMGARVILAVRPPMYRLARSFSDTDALILMYDPPPWQPDFMCPLLNVPAFADVNPDNLPLKAGYLFAEDRSYRLTFGEDLNVGVCWASGKRDLQASVAETARQKSLSFSQLVAPLAQHGVNLISLQQTHGDERAMRDLNVKDPMAGVTDFADTAWIIDQLDLVITVDTSVAHLAGGLGKPVWNLVRFDALWPWRQETDATCWYDSMKVYRQKAPYDWRDPLARVKADLSALLVDRERQKSAA